MSYSKGVPYSRAKLFADIHRDIHENKKENYLVIRDLERQAISYTEARHMVLIAASEPDPSKAFEKYMRSEQPRPIRQADHPTGCLAIYLIAAFVLTIILLMVLLVNPEALFGTTDIPAFITLSTIAVSIVYLIGIAGVWNYQKWGVFTLLGLSCLTILLNLAIGATFMGIAQPVFRMLLLIGLVSPTWDQFE